MISGQKILFDDIIQLKTNGDYKIVGRTIGFENRRSLLTLEGVALGNSLNLITKLGRKQAKHLIADYKKILTPINKQ